MAAGTYRITVQDDGRVFPCGEDEFVLAAMIRARCGPVSHGCCGGGCGVCRMRVVEGRYRSVKPMSRAHISAADESECIVLICCIKAESDLIIAGTVTKDDKRDWQQPTILMSKKG